MASRISGVNSSNPQIDPPRPATPTKKVPFPPPLSPRSRSQSFVTEMKGDNPELYVAIISPRSKFATVPDVHFDEAFVLINYAYQFLTNPLVRSHIKDQPGNQHRDAINRHIKDLLKLRDDLFRVINIGSRIEKAVEHGQLAEKYKNKLHEVCKSFLEEHEDLKMPEPSSGSLTPRSREQLQFQNAVRHACNLKDSVVQRYMADICVLNQAYQEELGQIQKPERVESLGDKVSSFIERVLSPRKKQ